MNLNKIDKIKILSKNPILSAMTKSHTYFKHILLSDKAL